MILPGKHPSWMAVTFSPEGIIRSVAPCGAYPSSGPASELVGRHITHLLAVASVLDLPQMIRAARETGSWEGEISLRAGGESFPSSGRLALISGMDPCEEFLLLFSMLEDPEQASQEEPDLHKVGASLRDIAHQMNNPLAVMMGYAQLVLMDMPAEGRLRGDIELIFEQTQTIAGLVEKLRDYGVALQGGTAVGSGSKSS